MREEMKGMQKIYEAQQEDMASGFLCPFCKKGIMVPADEEKDVPTYVCPVCGAYHGEFLHTRRVFYYTPLHLRVGRAIIARGGLGEAQSISSLSVELSHEFGAECSAEEVAEAIIYLEGKGVLEVSEGLVHTAGEQGRPPASTETAREGTDENNVGPLSGRTDGGN